MHESLFATIALSLALGAAGLLIGLRLRMPPLLLFITLGVAAGPSLAGLIQPEALGDVLLPLLNVAIAIIIFDAGLSLPAGSWRAASSVIQRMMLVVLPVTALAATFLARWVVGLPMETALLFGSLIVVTGPTVIGPLLRNVALSRSVDSALRWESVWANCVGAVLAGIMLENALGRYEGGWLPFFFVTRLLVGLFVGFLAGFSLSRWLLPAAVRAADPALPGILALAVAVSALFVANALYAHAGIVAAAGAGMMVAHQAPPGLANVRRFSDQISLLVIAFLFVLLSAQLDLRHPSVPWGQVLLVAAALTFVVRPAAAQLGLLGTSLNWRERLYVGLIGPRGIIAAAIASYSVIALRSTELRTAGLRLLAFAIIMLTGAVTSLFGKRLARWLRVQLDEMNTGIAIVGVDPLAVEMARAWQGRVKVLLIDADPTKCAEVDLAPDAVWVADALDEALYDRLIDAGCRRMVVKTANPALNNLIARLAIERLGVNRVFVAANAGGVDQAMHLLPERVLAFAPRGIELATINEAIAWGEARLTLNEAGNGQPLPRFAVAFGNGGVRLLRAMETPRGPVYCLAAPAGRPPTSPSSGSSAS